jgi:hypothetical protein
MCYRRSTCSSKTSMVTWNGKAHHHKNRAIAVNASQGLLWNVKQM